MPKTLHHAFLERKLRKENIGGRLLMSALTVASLPRLDIDIGIALSTTSHALSRSVPR